MSKDDNSSEYLAWYKYPEPNGRQYTEQELEDAEIVREIFDYCQLLLASINKTGWRKLFQFHGLEKLLAINEISGWFDTDTRKEASDGFKYQCLISGYDAERDEFGEYKEDSGLFISENGKSRQIFLD